jgi:hypothetical protein
MMKTLFKIVCLLMLVACGQNYRIEPRDRVMLAKRDFVFSDSSIAVKPHFIPLPAGDVRPEGWLRDWAEAAANGITGHLDERTPTFGMGWKGVGFEAMGADPKDGTGWPLEQCSYWLDGAVRLAYILQDSDLIKKTSERLNMVVDGVLNGGKSFVYWTDIDFQNGERATFNNWAHSHMGRALTAYYEATGDRRILEALTKVYSTFRAQPVPHDFAWNVSGCCNIDPMISVYELSHNHAILDSIRVLAADSATQSTVMRWNNGDFDSAHGVVTYENMRIPAMLYTITGDKSMLNATKEYVDWIDMNHLLPYYIASSEEYVAGVGATRHTESCNVACAPYTFQQMFNITGEGFWGDRIERIFFNAGPAPVSRDFQTMAYYQAPNRLDCFNHADHTIAGGDEVFRNIGYGVLCCVGNINRVIPNYIMNQWAATPDKGLAAMLYGPSRVNTVVADGIPVEIYEETTYPFEEQLRLNINLPKPTNFPLYIRIPAWCTRPAICLNGQPVKGIYDNGFVKIDTLWKKGDNVDLVFPMPVEVGDGCETPFPEQSYFAKRKLAQVRDVNSPYRCIARGPLLYALPVNDIDANTQDPDAKWNYALVTDKPEDAEVVLAAMPAHWSWKIEEAPVKLKVKAREFDWRPDDLLPLPKTAVTGSKEVEITLVPYGCTKFRISMFPIAKK